MPYAQSISLTSDGRCVLAGKELLMLSQEFDKDIEGLRKSPSMC